MNSQRILLPALAAALLAACSQKPAQEAAPASPPVAIVDGKPIGRDIYEFYAKGVANKPAGELTPEQRDVLIDNLVQGRVLAQQAEKDGTAKDPDVVALLELQRLQTLRQAVAEKYLKDRQPTDAERQAEYQAQTAQTPHVEYHVRHILLSTEPYAEKVVAKLDKGAKFEDLVKSESMEKENGGDLGWITPDKLPKLFADALAGLKVGEYTHVPVQTQYGFHVIRLEEKRDLTPPTLDSMKQRIDQQILGKKFKAYVDELTKTAKVEKKLENAPAGGSTAPPAGAAAAAGAAGTAAPADKK